MFRAIFAFQKRCCGMKTIVHYIGLTGDYWLAARAFLSLKVLRIVSHFLGFRKANKRGTLQIALRHPHHTLHTNNVFPLFFSPGASLYPAGSSSLPDRGLVARFAATRNRLLASKDRHRWSIRELWRPKSISIQKETQIQK